MFHENAFLRYLSYHIYVSELWKEEGINGDWTQVTIVAIYSRGYGLVVTHTLIC